MSYTEAFNCEPWTLMRVSVKYVDIIIMEREKERKKSPPENRGKGKGLLWVCLIRFIFISWTYRICCNKTIPVFFIPMIRSYYIFDKLLACYGFCPVHPPPPTTTTLTLNLCFSAPCGQI